MIKKLAFVLLTLFPSLALAVEGREPKTPQEMQECLSYRVRLVQWGHAKEFGPSDHVILTISPSLVLDCGMLNAEALQKSIPGLEPKK